MKDAEDSFRRDHHNRTEDNLSDYRLSGNASKQKVETTSAQSLPAVELNSTEKKQEDERVRNAMDRFTRKSDEYTSTGYKDIPFRVMSINGRYPSEQQRELGGKGAPRGQELLGAERRVFNWLKDNGYNPTIESDRYSDTYFISAKSESDPEWVARLNDQFRIRLSGQDRLQYAGKALLEGFLTGMGGVVMYYGGIAEGAALNPAIGAAVGGLMLYGVGKTAEDARTAIRGY